MKKQIGEFTLDNNVDACGTSFHDVYLTVNPVKLIKLLGNGSNDFDDYKCSKAWIFTKDGKSFTIYDWKSTSNYDLSYPSPRLFWSSDKVELHIGHMYDNLLDAIELQEMIYQLCK
jgi:hypothetical protein